ncbi:hypothetical protein Scep_011688 [Stephania cephalantha]|uniref:RING-CH-type domain-containing protein n=1 Tax=Stephania cephalantha TaxID=152367 RepID=A0AAP0P8N0_9MAGN
MDHEMKTKDEFRDEVSINVRSVVAAAGAVVARAEGDGVVKAKSSSVVVDEVGKDSCVIDIKGDDGATLSKENWESEKICRICHLSAEQPSEALDLIQIGCGCKGELGFAHRHCAEAWFKLKGNRYCEICGEVAKSITGTGDSSRFMEEWNDGPVAGANSSGRREAFWRGQPFCNFLMACLVIAFVLPWFFRVNLF